MVQVRRHGLVLDNGARDQLGKHRDKGAEVDDVPLGRGVLAVDIDGVAHGLEGEEGNANGQGHPQHRQADARDGGQVHRQEVPVLEKAQKQQVEHHRLPHKPPGLFVIGPVLLHQQAMGVVDENGEEHDEDVDRLSPAVKHQAHRQQHQIPPLQRHQKIHQQRQRQVGE